MELAGKTAAILCIFVAVLPIMLGTAQSPPAPIVLPPSMAPVPAPAPAPRHVNLTELFSLAGPFSTFLDYILRTQVIDTFQNHANDTAEHGGLTIFVPKDSAFSALKKTTFSNLTTEQLRTLVLYHALPEFYSLAEFGNLSLQNPVSTFAGGAYTLNVSDNKGLVHIASPWSTPKIASSVYTTRPVAVYELDKVLLPIQIFSTDPPLAPAPAPAPEHVKPSDGAGADQNGNNPKKSGEIAAGSAPCRLANRFIIHAITGIAITFLFL